MRRGQPPGQSENRGRNRGRQSDSESESAPLRRSRRLSGNPINPSSIQTRSIEAEARRERDRTRDRRSRQTQNSAGSRRRRRNRTPNSNNMRQISHSQSAMNGRSRTYSIEFAYPVPCSVEVGRPIYPPPAVLIHIHDNATGSEIPGDDELHNLILSVCPMRVDGDSSSTEMPDMRLLGATSAATPNLLNVAVSAVMRENTAHLPLNQQPGSFAVFPHVRISRAGNYRLQVAMLRVETSPGVASTPEGAITLAVADTDIFTVQEQQVRSVVHAQAQEFLDHIQLRGTAIPSPPP